MTLRVVPANVVTFALDHDGIAGQIQAESSAISPVLAATPSAYGPVGAPFTEALNAFAAALQTTGATLAGDYRHMGIGLRAGARGFQDTDASSATQFRLRPTGI